MPERGPREGDRPAKHATWSIPIGQIDVAAYTVIAVDLRQALPLLLPGAIAWAEARAREVAEKGASLTLSEIAIARAVGVTNPELIRPETARGSFQKH